jgi:hypothetical protein
MLVATALVIFIMVILTQAFTTGMDALRQLKTIGDMQEKLRTATIIMSKDLSADHFDASQKISDTALFTPDATGNLSYKGFFRLWHGSGPLTALMNGPHNYYEGTDGDGIDSYRVTDHMLHFTVKRKGIRREDFASAVVPLGSPLPGLGTQGSRFQDVANLYNYQWYEVAYFLANTGEVTSSGIPRYSLIRRQRLLVPRPDTVSGVDVNNPALAVQAGYGEISCRADPSGNGNFYFNNETDITVPQRRFGMVQTPGAPPAGADGGSPIGAWPNYYPLISDPDLTKGGDAAKAGSDLLVTDVLSFQVMLVVQENVGGTLTNSIKDLEYLYTTYPTANNLNTVFNTVGGPRVFDTWSSVSDGVYQYSGPAWSTPGTATSLPLRPQFGPGGLLPGQFRILGLQITLRIWDAKTQQTRQLTFVQNM